MSVKKRIARALARLALRLDPDVPVAVRQPGGAFLVSLGGIPLAKVMVDDAREQVDWRGEAARIDGRTW